MLANNLPPRAWLSMLTADLFDRLAYRAEAIKELFSALAKSALRLCIASSFVPLYVCGEYMPFGERMAAGTFPAPSIFPTPGTGAGRAAERGKQSISAANCMALQRRSRARAACVCARRA